jgi:integrase
MTETTTPRAKKGTGRIFERPSGWYAQWSSRDPQTGARIQHKKGAFRTEREARKFLTGEIGKVDSGTFVPAPKPKLLTEVLDAWLATKTDCRPTTLEGYTVAVEKWLKPRLGGTKVPALTEQGVKDALAELAAQGGKKGGPLSARTCQLALVTLRQALKFAMRQGWAVRNVAIDVTVKQTRKEMSCWTEAEARKFLGAVRDDRLFALWALYLTRGPRRGELAGLRWDLVDLDEGFMWIRRTRVLVGGHAQDSTPKTDAGVRRIGLDPGLVDILRAHRRRQIEDKLRAGTAWADTGYVFTDVIGEPVKPDHISDQFAKLCVTAAVPVIRLHDTRHTAVTLMLESGEDLKVVSTVVGHADTRITQQIYQHVLDVQVDDAGARLSRMVL